MRTGRSDCESDDDVPSRPSSEMDQHSDTESDQHSNDYESGNPKRGILKSRPSSSCLGIIDILDEEAKARWTACDGSHTLLRQHSSCSLSYSSNKRTTRRRNNYADKTMGASKRRHSPKRPETENKKSNVVSFSRSLKLLGLQPEDFGIRKSEGADTINKVPRKVTVRAPTMHTRVMERSVSLDALKSALHESASTKKCVSTEQLDRETIAKAVYEEWYFKKLEEARRKRELLLIEERNAKEELERVRAERLEKAEENFARWKEAKMKERKNAERKNVETMKKPSRPRPEFVVRVSKEKSDEAFYAWKKEKEKFKELEIQTKQSDLEKEKEKEKAQQEKRRDAINTFNAWKKQADEKLKKQHLDRETKKKKADEKEARDKQEREANSCTSFLHWKNMKDELAKKEAKERRLALQTAEQKTKMRQYGRLYEAEQAFEEWLDDVEERVQRRARAGRPWSRAQAVPPWSPAGKIP